MEIDTNISYYTGQIMTKVTLSILLFVFMATSGAKENEEGKYAVNLISPESTYATCATWGRRDVKKEEIIFLLEKCFTKNGRKELAVYFYLGAALLSGMRQINETNNNSQNKVEGIGEKYRLKEIIDALPEDRQDEVFLQIDTVNFIYDLYEFMVTYTYPGKQMMNELRDVRIEEKRASGLETSGDRDDHKAKRMILFFKGRG